MRIMKFSSFLSLVVLSICLVGCSAGGSDGSIPSNSVPNGTSPSNPGSKVRFVNTATRMGTVTFYMGNIQASVPARSASPAFSVPAGTTVVTMTNGSTEGTRAVTIPDASAIDVIAYESPAGALSADSIYGRVTVPDSSKALLTYFNFPTLGSLGDAYIVPAEMSISNVDPTFASATGSRTLAPGTYTIALTPAGKKTILFQSGPLTLAAGQQALLIAAPASRYVMTPQPLALSFDEDAQTLEDSRPVVKLLRRIDSVPQDGPSTISVDGDLIVQLPSATLADDASYHLTPGTRSFLQTGSGAPIAFTFQAEAGTTYVERFGWMSLSPVTFGDIWLPPTAAIDYPIPADRARVRLIVESLCREEVVRIDGAAIAYGNQQHGNSGVVLDRNAGAIQIEIFTPDGVSPERPAQTIPLVAGHYYVFRALRFDFLEFGPPSYCLNGAPASLLFESSGDQ
jgi:hypothetical protein